MLVIFGDHTGQANISAYGMGIVGYKGDAWSYFSHDQADSRAYRWGEDGMAGITDDRCAAGAGG
jgi:hypothetical protein